MRSLHYQPYATTVFVLEDRVRNPCRVYDTMAGNYIVAFYTQRNSLCSSECETLSDLEPFQWQSEDTTQSLFEGLQSDVTLEGVEG